MTPGRLHPADLEALIEGTARLVVKLLREDPGSNVPEPPAQAGGLMTAAEAAHDLGVGRAWVYDHASLLGAIPLGDGPRPRLRFDPACVAAVRDARASREGSRGSQQAQVAGATEVPRRRRRRSARTSVQSGPELLPIRGRER